MLFTDRSCQGEAPTLTLRGMRVLLVCMDCDHCDRVYRFLTAGHAEVSTAESAAEAVELLAMTTPDILLADAAMLDANGYQLIRGVRSRILQAEPLPAAALVRRDRPDELSRAVLGGFELHIGKPVEGAELLAVVTRLAAMADGRRLGDATAEPAVFSRLPPAYRCATMNPTGA
jgi:DNA-binding response OmpR family regulator